MKKFTIFTVVAIFAMALVGCETTKETNSNKAIVVNDNANIKNMNMNTNVAMTDKNDEWNANMTEADFEKDRAKYETKSKTYKDDTIGQGAKDLWLWTKTRASLATVEDLRDSTINVDVTNGVITLKGTVGSDAHKAAAEKAAKVEGAASVKNMLTVNKADSLTNQALTDSDKKADTNANMKK